MNIGGENQQNQFGPISSVHQKSVGYNFKNSKFNFLKKQKSKKLNDKRENRLIYCFHSDFKF
jgi:hypothetical protein